MDFCPMVMGSHFIMVFLHSLCLNSVLESMMIKLLVWLLIQKQMPPPGLKDLLRVLEDVSVKLRLTPDFWGTGTTHMPTTLSLTMLCMWYPWYPPLQKTGLLPTLKPVPLLWAQLLGVFNNLM